MDNPLLNVGVIDNYLGWTMLLQMTDASSGFILSFFWQLFFISSFSLSHNSICKKCLCFFDMLYLGRTI